MVAFVNWLAVLIQGEVPESLHDFVASYVRYATQVSAYLLLAADPYPWFRVQLDYPVDVEIDPPRRQSRWTGFFRLLLALPALALAATLGGGLGGGSSGSSGSTQGGEEYWVASWGLSAGRRRRGRRVPRLVLHRSRAGGRRAGSATWSATRSATPRRRSATSCC